MLKWRKTLLVLLTVASLLLVRSWLTREPTPYRTIDTSTPAFDKLNDGMTESEIEELLGGPAGDYTGGRLWTLTSFYIGPMDESDDRRWFEQESAASPTPRAPAPLENPKEYDRQWINRSGAIIVTFGADGRARRMKTADVILKPQWYDEVMWWLKSAEEWAIGGVRVSR